MSFKCHILAAKVSAYADPDSDWDLEEKGDLICDVMWHFQCYGKASTHIY